MVTLRSIEDISGSWLREKCADCGSTWLFRSNIFPDTGGKVPRHWCRECGGMSVRRNWIDIDGIITQIRDSGPKQE